MTAQGNALGTRIPTNRKPCKGGTILGCRDVGVAGEKPGFVSPLQGSDLGWWTWSQGVALGCLVTAPAGRTHEPRDIKIRASGWHGTPSLDSCCPWLRHPLVKSRIIAKTRRNFSNISLLCDGRAHFEIGFVRCIFRLGAVNSH
jgi:hypothetical protein